MGVTTTSSNFPVVDISHKPKRYQHDNLANAGVLESEQDPSASEVAMSCVPLHNVTLERAIQYYESNATGEFTALYSRTAEWLRKLLAIGIANVERIERAERAKKEGGNNETETFS